MCGSGDAVQRCVQQLREVGAAAVAPVDDPYALVRQLASGAAASTTDIVLLLACLYPEELAVIDAVRQVAPDVRILVGAVDGASGLLAASIRAGIDGIYVNGAVEWLGEPPALPPIAPAARSAPASAHEEPSRVAHGTHTAERDLADDPQPLLSQEELRALLGEEPAA